MCFASTFRFFTHVEVDGLDEVPFEDSETLRLPDRQRLQHLEELRAEFLTRWQAGDEIDELVQRIFAVPTDTFLPAHPPRYILGYNVWCPLQAQAFRRAMRDLDHYVAVLSRFALRVRVLSVAQPLPEHPDGYPDLSRVLRTIRYLGDGLWLRAVKDFEHEKRKSLCWRYLPGSLVAEGAVPERMVDALELLLYKAQIVRILASDPVGELHDAVAEGADEYVNALHQVVQAVMIRRRRESYRRFICRPDITTP
ncbi:MAG: hypothetical protein RMM08_01670 [Armatimonadota bacterium]|nr:hypothetical protein [bacterium]MDW8320046.1 hypothetical protein [Armatimonadota bacterium]